MQQEIKIFADQRERNVEILSTLSSSATLEVRTLPVGDYVVSDRIAIERKTIRDFESSMKSGRLFDQVKRIHEYYERPIVIIEGDRSEFLLGNNVIMGAIIALYIDYNSAVMLSADAKETAKMIVSIAKHEQTTEKRSLSLKGSARAYTTRDFQLMVVGNLPGVGPKLSEALLSHFKSPRNIANASVDELMEVDKIGRKKAERIYAALNEKF
ncbi:MAG: ERCC4 domain-containing protein [Candidatus Micrarchaeaceae archaeon]